MNQREDGESQRTVNARRAPGLCPRYRLKLSHLDGNETAIFYRVA